MKIVAALVSLIVGSLLIFAISDFPAWGDGQSPVNDHVSRFYIENAMAHSHVPNVVTAVLADYRGFDTMFETAVVFVAAIGIMGLLRRKKHKKLKAKKGEEQHESVIMKEATKIMVPFMQLFSLYVVAHGHHSPGGGFQGGVILGASLILIALSFDLKTALETLSEKKNVILCAVGVLIFSGIGAICLFLGGNFLDYSVWHVLLPATDTVMARSHGMLGVEIGVALTVMTAMMIIFANLASDGTMDRSL